jgi:hypothetical protein
MAASKFLVALLALTFVAAAHADVYMHNPRGSNNRLNERSANRNNGNRMFDSQNNNRGGYNKGDVGVGAAPGAPAATQLAQHKQQYDFMYYSSNVDGSAPSELTIEWTNQHGCGGDEHGDPHKLNCQIVMQYMCVPAISHIDASDNKGISSAVDREVDCRNECHMPPVEGNDNCLLRFPPCSIVRGIYLQSDCAAYQKMYNTTSGVSVKTGKWVPGLYKDPYNCPHKCTGDANAHTRAECQAAGGTWAEYKNIAGSTTRDHYAIMRDGTTTNRQQYTRRGAQTTQAQRFDSKEGDINNERGQHEPWEWYDECDRRERNRGLFTADQNLRNNNNGYSSAVYTRQNPNNNQRGYECPEERDHYPYWHPSPWVDIVVYTDRMDMCPFYQQESQNVKGKGLCRNTATCLNCIRYNRPETCRNNGGVWREIPPHNMPAPECRQAPWARVNHNGNGRHGQFNSYNWTIPYLGTVPHKCVVRLRYNISTDDYDYSRVNSSFNNNNGQGIRSPVQQNPNVDMGADNQALRLAINTAQFGRTFQDRSHVFTIKPRTNWMTTDYPRAKLYNINVRGKRGNIVQTYPAVEYDFVPNALHIKQTDLVHFQWAGSNTHNNGNPAGDGQAGDAGEGTRGTDRHNVVELRSDNFQHSFPTPYERTALFANIVAAEPAHSDSINMIVDPNTVAPTEMQRSWALRMASGGFYSHIDKTNPAAMYVRTGSTMSSVTPLTSATEKLQELLNNARASYEGGVFNFAKGHYNYMCTRNHNFSNRDQKATLWVEE